MAKHSLFISDLHLAPERPQIIDLFTRFVNEVAVNANTLYILGDFLEYWIGDDDKAEGLQPVFAALDKLHQAGVQVKFMHGNRDFLLGRKMAGKHHFEIIDDPVVEHLNNTPVLLMHGDLLCTDDVDYQKFRLKVRNRALQSLFLLLPLFIRERIARSLRNTSEKATAVKSDEIMDVNQQAVIDIMRQHGVFLLIHGHTHRPAIHEMSIDGSNARRIVLGDWYKDGNYLEFRNNEPELVQFS